MVRSSVFRSVPSAVINETDRRVDCRVPCRDGSWTATAQLDTHATSPPSGRDSRRINVIWPTVIPICRPARRERNLPGRKRTQQRPPPADPRPLRELPFVTSAKFSAFLTPPPCPHLHLIFTIKFTQHPSQHALFHDPPSPLMWTSYLEAPLSNGQTAFHGFSALPK